MDDFATICKSCCDERLDDKDRSDLHVAGFGLEMLIPLLLPILTEMLSGCFHKATAEEVAAELAKGNESAKVRAACFRAVGKATDNRISARKQYKIAQGLGEGCGKATDSQRLEFITGVKEATNWEQL